MPKKKKEENDVWMIDPKEGAEIKKGVKVGSRGLICPKNNKTIKKRCAVCDEVSRLYNSGDPKNIDIARQKKAKINYFLNIVLPENPNKSIILEIGRNAGNDITAGIEQGWRDIAHPKAGQGRELLITKKSVDGRNHYSVSPSLEKADWDIPDETLDNLTDLDNIISMIEKDELTSENYMNISSIAMGESLKFRMCPPAKGQSPDSPFKRMAWVWRHWGVTQEEIDGEVEIDFGATDDDSDAPWEGETTSKGESATTGEDTPTTSEEDGPRERCFGDDALFDEEDDECQRCKDFKACKRTILKAKK